MENRIYYLDHLRVFLTVLVLFHHAALPYTNIEGVWYVTDIGDIQSTTTHFLTFFIAINQAFFMGLFFFLSGYFTPLSYNRKTTSQFMKDRLLRLGIPILAYLLIISPIVQYMALKGNSTNFWEFYKTEILTLQSLEIGPLWFVEILLVFTLFFVGMRVYRKDSFIHKSKSFPSARTLFIVAILLGGVTFLIRLFFPVGVWILGLQVAYLPSYLFMFWIGTVAGRQNWLREIPRKTTKKWLWSLTLTGPLVPISLIFFPQGNLNGGWNLQAMIYAMWETFIDFGICIGLLALFKKYNRTQPLTNRLSKTAYTVYIIHPIFIVGYSLFFQGKSLYPMLKFGIVCIAGTITCFVVASLIIRIPYAKKIL